MKVHVRQVINLVNIQQYHPHVDTDLMVLQNKNKKIDAVLVTR